MNPTIYVNDSAADKWIDPFEVFSTSELLSLGLIDEATMQELMEPWESEVEMEMAA